MALTAATGLLRCPVCQEPLSLTTREALCPAGHRFDVARQGYLNLVNAAEPTNADTPAMVAARARVHASGLFDGVAAAISVAAGPAATLAEMGAGTAAYLAACLAERPGARGVAVDISKAAARAAARAHPAIASIVADVWQPLPLATSAFDVVIAAFAPRNGREFQRVLTAGGRLVVAVPEPDHLAELRQRYGLLGVEPGKLERLLDSLAGRFAEVGGPQLVRSSSFQEAAVVADLIAMGPNAFHGLPAHTTAGTVSVAVRVQTFRRLP